MDDVQKFLEGIIATFFKDEVDSRDWAELDNFLPQSLQPKEEKVVVLRRRSHSVPPTPSRKLVMVAEEEVKGTTKQDVGVVLPSKPIPPPALPQIGLRPRQSEGDITVSKGESFW